MHIALSRTGGLGAGFATAPLLLALTLPLLRRLDVPVTIRHPLCGTPVHLLSYSHKDFWQRRQARAPAMQRLKQIIRSGDTVIEAGGRIGYDAQYLASLVGATGHVHVFEPASQNTSFLQQNLAPLRNALHIKAALAAADGSLPLITDTADRLLQALGPERARPATAKRQRPMTPRVISMRLDDYTLRHGVVPQFLKIDVADGALAVLSGAQGTLAQLPALMVRVTRDQKAIFDMLGDFGFLLSDATGQAVTTHFGMQGHIFAERQRRLSDVVRQSAGARQIHPPHKQPNPRHIPAAPIGRVH